MSAVLWANRLSGGAVVSDQSDKHALHKHLPQLDRIAKAVGVPALSSWCDTTDLRFNVEDLSLPEGMTSTDQWMARDGVWVDAGEAAKGMSTILAFVETRRPRFGLFRNDCDAVIAELRESAAFARETAETASKFNFSVVM